MFERYIVCNRCGKRKSIQPEDTISGTGYSSLIYDKRLDGNNRYYDLCDNCTNEFEKFMRIGKNASENE